LKNLVAPLVSVPGECVQIIYKKITLSYIVLILEQIFFNSAFSSSAVFSSRNFLLHDIFNQPSPTNDNKEQGLKEKKHPLKITILLLRSICLILVCYFITTWKCNCFNCDETQNMWTHIFSSRSKTSQWCIIRCKS